MNKYARWQRSTGSIRPACLSMRCVIMALMLFVPSLGETQVTTNITSSGLNTQVNQVGNSYNITGGTRPGNGPNLFHSFGNFSVGGGDLANFLNNTGLSTSNILGRVTGSNISQIYGTIDTTAFGNANLFLMNPSGIVLGPGASLNVGGSISFTTAQYIRLFDGLSGNANFYANPANDGLANSILTINSSAFEFLSATPAGYGFLTTPNPTPTITVQGSALSVPSGQSISLIGGKVVIEGGAKLTAPGGSIKLASVASPGEFDAASLGSLPNGDGTSFTSYTSMSLASGSNIDVHGPGTVLIKGGQLVLSVNNTTLSTSTSSTPDMISLSQGSSIIASNSGADLGVNVDLTASKVDLNGSSISTQSEGAERGGNITVTANQLTLDQVAGIFSGTGFGSPGTGGDVAIQGPAGEGGVAASVTLSGFSQIGASTGGDGLGGNITITTTSLNLSGGSNILSSTSGTAANGNITVRVQDARLTGGSHFSSDTSSIIDGLVGGSITVQGVNGGKVTSLLLAGQESGIRANTFGQNQLGNILVQTETLKMMDGALIQSGTPLSFASAGTITIDAGVVDIASQSRISSSAFSLDAGPITITAGQLTLDNSTIAADTSSPTGGRGGDVILDVGSASISNGAAINSSASNTGNAGNINILASKSVTMTSGSSLTASSTGTGNAGNIRIESGSTVLIEQSSVTTEASQASGGQITINAPRMIRLIGSPISTSVAGAAGDSNGGNISIDPDFVILQGSQILARAFAGSGGAIDVTAGLFLADPASVVDASSTLGVSGTVQINAPINNLSSVVARLPESLLAVQALLRASCAAKLAQGATSSFVERGRDGIPAGPDGLLASPYLPITSGHSTQLRAKPLIGKSEIQLRRLFRQEMPASVTLISDHSGCSS
ncbi:MAG: filamentous hemagglutinin N-terminal domain-containing protein [Nitrospira sp.]|nr:MAG: filamentous hemagglutinin N-terminal domain-containing protein [Nitrospira sp.]